MKSICGLLPLFVLLVVAGCTAESEPTLTAAPTFSPQEAIAIVKRQLQDEIIVLRAEVVQYSTSKNDDLVTSIYNEYPARLKSSRLDQLLKRARWKARYDTSVKRWEVTATRNDGTTDEPKDTVWYVYETTSTVEGPIE